MHRAAIFLNVPYFKQDTGYTCGPTSLQMVLAYYGIRASERTLARELETDTDIGTRHSALIAAATKRRLHCYVNEQAPYEEISYLLSLNVPAIIHFREPSENDGHYSVVVGMTNRHVLLNDPWNGSGLTLLHNDFLSRWRCGEEGVCRQWLMGISKEPFRVGRHYAPKG